MTEQKEDIENRYQGVRGFLRLLREGLKITYTDLRQSISHFFRFVSGRLEGRGEMCQIKDCESESVATHPRSESYKPDLEVCWKHKLGVYLIPRLIILTAIAVFAVGTIYLMGAL